MAGRVQGITIELNGDVTPLQKALTSANKEIKTTQTQLKDVEKLLKLDPKNVDLLTQREKLLAKSVEEVKKKLDTLKQAEAQAQQQFQQGKISEEQYDALKREIIATEQELKKLEKASAQANATLAHVGAVAQEISDKTGNLAEKTKGLSAAAAGAVVALGGIALNAVKSADDLNTMAKQTGLSTEELQQMSYAADLVDVSLDDMTSAAARLKRGMASSSKDTQAAFAQLGVSVRSANGQLRNSTDVFYDVIAALGNVSDETERDVLAMQLFGKSADSLAGIIDDGGAALKRYGEDAKRMGLILSQDTLDGLNKVNDRLDELKGQMKGVLAQNGAKVIEAFLPLIEEAANGVGALAEKFASLDSEQIKNIATIAAVVAGISPMLSLISKISGAVAALTPVVSSLFALVSAHPVGAVVTLVAALTAGIIGLAKAAKDSKTDLNELTKASDGLGTAIENANKAYETQAKDIDTAYAKAQYYLTRIKELGKESSLTAEQQWEYTKAVEALNEIYPDLNLQIDENTGRITDNVFMIEKQTKALRDQALQQALQAKYQDILEAMAAAQREVLDNQLALRDAEVELTTAKANERLATEALAAAERALAEAQASNAQDTILYQQAVEEASRQLTLAQEETGKAQSKFDQLTDAVSAGQAKVKGYADEYERAVSGLASIMASAGENAGKEFAAGLVKGMKIGQPAVESQSIALGETAARGTRFAMRSHSPSKVAMEIGKDWDEGLVIGVKQGQDDVEDASAQVAQAMIPVTQNTISNTTNHNVGGISVTVNTAPGQDVQASAEAVMDEIQAAVDREGAAL